MVQLITTNEMLLMDAFTTWLFLSFSIIPLSLLAGTKTVSFVTLSELTDIFEGETESEETLF